LEGEFVDNLIRIRSSMLPSAADCMRRAAAAQFKTEITDAGYRLRERLPVIGGIVGTGTHKGTEHTIETYIKTGNHARITDCIEIGIESIKSEIISGIIWDPTTPSKNDAEQQCKQMVNAYCVMIAPNIKPVAVPEKYRQAKISEDILFTGSTDIETIENDIRDVKTGYALKPFQAQQGGYSLLRKAAIKQPTNRLIVDFLPRTSVKKTFPGPTTKIYDVDLCEQMAYSIILRIASAVRKFRLAGNSNAFPCNPMSILCSEKYCTAFGTEFCRL
jgi:hypothetical protein